MTCLPESFLSLVFLLISTPVLALAACPQPIPSSLNLTAQASQASSTFSVAVTGEPSCTWTISTPANWISFPANSGPLGPSNISFNAIFASNNTSSVRTTQIAVSINGWLTTTYTIKQNSTSCTYAVNPTEINLPASGGSGQYQVTSNPPDCEPLYGVSTPGGSFSASTYLIGPNPGPARTFTIYHGYDYSSQTAPFAIHQAAAGSAGNLSVVCDPTTVPAGVNAYTLNPYKATCTASGGSAPYTWSVSSGTLPQGLTLQPNGNTLVIQGSSPVPGFKQYTIQVQDSQSQKATFLYSGTQPVTDLLLVSAPQAVPSNQGANFSTVAQVEGGTPPYFWSVSAGSLPPGVSFTQSGNSGILHGIVGGLGPYSYTLQVLDSSSPALVRTFSFTVNVVVSKLTFITTTLPATRTGEAYGFNLQGGGGVAPYTFSLVSGALPPGLSISSADPNFAQANFFGAATTEGTYNFTLRLTDGSSPPLTVDQNFTIAVTLGLRMSCAVPSGESAVGAPFSVTCTITSSEPAPYFWALFDGTLPAGVTFPTSPNTQSITISGTPTAPGPYRLTVQAQKIISPFPLVANTVVQGTIVPSSVSAAPSIVSARATPSGPAPAEQTIAISGHPTGGTFSAKVSVGDPWLTARIVKATLPGSIALAFHPETLAAGSVYHGQVSVQMQSGAEAVIDVAFSYERDGPAKLDAQPAQLSLLGIQNSSSVLATLLVRNSASGDITYSATAADPWFSLRPSTAIASSSTPDWVDVAALPTLAPGTYHSQIFLRPDSGASVVSIPVTLSIAATPQLLALSPNVFDFTVSAVPASQSFTLPSNGLLSWNLTPHNPSGQNWLSIAPVSGSSSPSNAASATLGVNPASLAPGTYYGSVESTPQTASVQLNVVDPANPGPPILSSGSLLVTGTPESIVLSNPGNRAAAFTAQASSDNGRTSITVDPASGTIPAFSKSTVTVGANPTGLASGIRTGKIQFGFPSATATVRVTTANTDSTCQPASLVPVLTTLPDPFNIPVARPVTLFVKASDNCGTLVTSGRASATFDNGEDALPLNPVTGGWTAAWTPRIPSVVHVTVWISANGLAGNTTSLGIVSDDPVAPPTIAGIVNSASYTGLSQAAPGSWISIFGDRLATATPSDTIVRLGTQPLPLSYTSNGLVNALLPYRSPANTLQSLTVERAGALSAPSSILLTDALPALYTTNGQGTGQAAALLANTASIAAPENAFPGSHPAARGSYVSLFASGLGAVINTPADGQPAPSTPPFATTVNTPQVKIGGLPADVTFSGLAPGLTGLYQINVRIPDAAPVGDSIPVTLCISSTDSNTATIAIQ